MNIKACAGMMLVALLLIGQACTRPLADAEVAKSVHYYSRDFAATPNEIYYALRWALEEGGWPVAGENLQGGIIKTSWLPVTSDSHYIDVFGRRDFGVTNSYHRLEINVVPEGDRTAVEIGSRTKALVARLKSSGVEERRVLDLIGNYLRRGEPAVTNLGIDE